METNTLTKANERILKRRHNLTLKKIKGLSNKKDQSEDLKYNLNKDMENIYGILETYQKNLNSIKAIILKDSIESKLKSPDKERIRDLKEKRKICAKKEDCEKIDAKILEIVCGEENTELDDIMESVLQSYCKSNIDAKLNEVCRERNINVNNIYNNYISETNKLQEACETLFKMLNSEKAQNALRTGMVENNFRALEQKLTLDLNKLHEEINKQLKENLGSDTNIKIMGMEKEIQNLKSNQLLIQEMAQFTRKLVTDNTGELREKYKILNVYNQTQQENVSQLAESIIKEHLQTLQNNVNMQNNEIVNLKFSLNRLEQNMFNNRTNEKSNEEKYNTILKNLKDQEENFKKECDIKALKEKKLLDELEILKKDILEIKDKLKYKIKIDKMQKKYESENLDFKQINNIFMNKIDDLEKKLKESSNYYINMIEHNDEEFKTIREELREAHNDFFSLEDLQEELKKKQEASINEVKSQILNLENKFKNSNQLLNEKSIELSNLKSSLENKEKERSKEYLEDKMQRLKEEKKIEETMKSINDLFTKMQFVENEKNEASKKYAEDLIDKQNWIIKINDLIDKYEKIKSDINNYNIALQNIGEKNNSLTLQFNNLQNSLNLLKDKVDKAIMESNTFKETYHNKITSEIEKKINNEIDINNLKQKINEIQEKSNESHYNNIWEKKFNEFKQEINNKEIINEISQFKLQKNDLEKEIIDLKKKLDNKLKDEKVMDKIKEINFQINNINLKYKNNEDFINKVRDLEKKLGDLEKSLIIHGPKNKRKNYKNGNFNNIDNKNNRNNNDVKGFLTEDEENSDIISDKEKKNNNNIVQTKIMKNDVNINNGCNEDCERCNKDREEILKKIKIVQVDIEKLKNKLNLSQRSTNDLGDSINIINRENLTNSEGITFLKKKRNILDDNDTMYKSVNLMNISSLKDLGKSLHLIDYKNSLLNAIENNWDNYDLFNNLIEISNINKKDYKVEKNDGIRWYIKEQININDNKKNIREKEIFKTKISVGEIKIKVDKEKERITLVDENNKNIMEVCQVCFRSHVGECNNEIYYKLFKKVDNSNYLQGIVCKICKRVHHENNCSYLNHIITFLKIILSLNTAKEGKVKCIFNKEKIKNIINSIRFISEKNFEKNKSNSIYNDNVVKDIVFKTRKGQADIEIFKMVRNKYKINKRNLDIARIIDAICYIEALKNIIDSLKKGKQPNHVINTKLRLLTRDEKLYNNLVDIMYKFSSREEKAWFHYKELNEIHGSLENIEEKKFVEKLKKKHWLNLLKWNDYEENKEEVRKKLEKKLKDKYGNKKILDKDYYSYYSNYINDDKIVLDYSEKSNSHSDKDIGYEDENMNKGKVKDTKELSCIKEDSTKKLQENFSTNKEDLKEEKKEIQKEHEKENGEKDSDEEDDI